MYIFDFINSYFSSLYYCFGVNRFSLVTMNLMTILAFKQIVMNIVEFFQDKIFTGRKINKIRDKEGYKQNADEIQRLQGLMADKKAEIDKLGYEQANETRKNLKLKEHGKLAEQLIECKDIEIHQQIEEQLVMKPNTNTLVFYYREAILQLGYLSFFACAFTLAPLFSVITNLIEVRIKLNSLARYNRRFQAEPAHDIGAWMRIL